MQATRAALFGVLGVGYATFLLGVVNYVFFRALEAEVFEDRGRIVSTMGLVVGLISFALTVTNIVSLIAYARSIRGARAASLAETSWMLAIVGAVLGWGVRYVLRGLVSPDEPLLLSVPVDLVHWVQVGVFCGSLYRLLGERSQSLSYVYGVGVVGTAVAMSMARWAYVELVLRPSWEAGASPSSWRSVLEWASWSLNLLWVVAITGLIVGATRRLRIAPDPVGQIFD